MGSIQHPNALALVTGGGSGIGFATTRALASKGFKVAVGDLREDLEERVKSLRDSGLEVVGMKLDVADWDSCVNFVKASMERFQTDHVDVLVNNAGIIRDNLFVKMTREEWDAVMRVHLYGAFNMTKQVVEGMIRNGHGRIINMSSLSWMGNVGQANYSAAKAGLIGFTKTLAKELGRYNVTVNAVDTMVGLYLAAYPYVGTKYGIDANAIVVAICEKPIVYVTGNLYGDGQPWVPLRARLRRLLIVRKSLYPIGSL